MKNTLVKYRTWYKGIGPSKIKIKVPGWGGIPGYGDGAHPQPWHCKPFIDAATYGLELVYPWDAECVVSLGDDGEVKFEGDFSEDEAACSMKFPPFMTFAENHYGFTSSLDIETEPGQVLRIEPHPRFFTDVTGEVPVAVPGHIEAEWWSRIFFVVFKSPKAGERHVFRKGDPYAQILVLPRDSSYEVRPMTTSEQMCRAKRDELIVNQSANICSHAFKNSKGHSFNNKYKVLSKICNKGGSISVDEHLAAMTNGRQKPMKRCAKMCFRRKKK